MSLWALPREPLGEIGETVPDGFIRADELMEFALPAVWGKDYANAAMEALPLGVEKSEKLAEAIANGRAEGVAQRLKDALVSGRLLGWEFRRRSRAEWFPPQRIPSGDWSSVNPHSLVVLLHTGSGYFLEQSMPGSDDGAVIAFKNDEAEVWLRSLTPATRLPRLSDLSSAQLPYDNVPLSTALCWRAGQTAKHWFDVQSMGASIRDSAAAIEAFSPEDSSRTEFDSICFDLADRLAAKIRRNRAALELLKLMAEGRLNAWGLKSPGHGELERIESDEFVVRREIVAYEDMLIPGKSSDNTEQSIAVRQGTWKHVRFLRSELLRGLGKNEDQTGSLEETSTQTEGSDLPVRRPRMKAAREWAKELEASWTTGCKKLGRDDTIKRLMSQFELSREQAREIWGTLPKEIRRGRGNPGQG